MHLQVKRQGHTRRGDRAAHACLRSQACRSAFKAGGSLSSSAWRPSLTNLLKTYCAIVSLVYASSSTPAMNFLPSRPCNCFSCGPQRGLVVKKRKHKSVGASPNRQQPSGRIYMMQAVASSQSVDMGSRNDTCVQRPHWRSCAGTGARGPPGARTGRTAAHARSAPRQPTRTCSAGPRPWGRLRRVEELCSHCNAQNTTS